MRTQRKAYKLSRKPYVYKQRAQVVKKEQQKGGSLLAATALGKYTAKYTLGYSNYKTDANGYVKKYGGYKSWADRQAHNPDNVKCAIM